MIVYSSCVQTLEAGFVTNTYFNVIRSHLTFKTLFECLDGIVDSVIQLQVVAVSLLQEGLSVDGVLAHGSSFPCKVGT